MERFLLYLDDLDDLYGAAGLVWEDVRNGIVLAATALLVSIVAAAAFLLASLQPTVALAVSTLLFGVFLYRSIAAPALKSWA